MEALVVSYASGIIHRLYTAVFFADLIPIVLLISTYISVLMVTIVFVLPGLCHVTLFWF